MTVPSPRESLSEPLTGTLECSSELIAEPQVSTPARRAYWPTPKRPELPPCGHCWMLPVNSSGEQIVSVFLAILDSEAVSDYFVDATTATPPELAVQVARAVGWRAQTPSYPGCVNRRHDRSALPSLWRFRHMPRIGSVTS